MQKTVDLTAEAIKIMREIPVLEEIRLSKSRVDIDGVLEKIKIAVPKLIIGYDEEKKRLIEIYKELNVITKDLCTKLSEMYAGIIPKPKNREDKLKNDASHASYILQKFGVKVDFKPDETLKSELEKYTQYISDDIQKKKYQYIISEL